MFHLHYDTSLERLADRLADLLAHRDAADLLRPQTVLVPQPGLERWLVQRLAGRHGIAANLEFLMPAQMVWRVLRACHPELPVHSLFDRNVLAWRLLDLLERLAPTQLAIAALVEGESGQLHRFQLAQHLAQLFERYQAYRRDLLDSWERGAEPADVQAILWRALVEATSEPSRNRLLGDFLRKHDAAQGTAPPPGLPARLFAFGCINVSPDVLRFLGVLGRHVDVHFLFPTPCREYWGDIPPRRDAVAAQLCDRGGDYFNEPPNPLLVSMGGLGRDFVAQVFGYDKVQPDTETGPSEIEPPRDTLLHRVQADVMTLASPGAGAGCANDDDSLQIHVCHSPMREVEVLHDRLLDLFQRHADLEPRDVAVMVPDIAKYAPCVEAVFGALPGDDPRRIPWTTADRPAGQDDTVSAVFLSLLDIPASRLGLDDVLGVLATPVVARAMDLDDADLDDLAAIAAEAGICRDEDAADREAQGLPAYREFSWEFGRTRLLLGYLLGRDAADGDDLVHGIAPLTDIEGAHASALGQLLRVERLLHQWRQAARREHTPAQWQHLLNRLLDALVPDTFDHVQERALESIRRAVAALGEQPGQAAYAGHIDWQCMREFLRQQLADARMHQRFLAGGVSVCSMVPLRNVPFRVICVLGLDAQSYPRRDPADALNRMHADVLADHRRLGDRSVREDDRYLFLETLMAARDVLHLSYTGLSARDGSRIEPSVLVSELLDTLATGYFRDMDAARKAVVVAHPLQPFSRRLFDGSDARLYTYRGEWLAGAGTVSGQGGQGVFADIAWPRTEPEARYDLAEIKRFFAAPQRYFLSQCVGLLVADAGESVTGREPLEDDPRVRATRERRLLQRLVRDGAAGLDGLDGLDTWSRAHGWAPPLALGTRVNAESLGLVAPQAEVWRQRRDAGLPPPQSAFELALPSGRILAGRLSCRDSAGVVGWIGSAGSGKNWMQWWLEALVASAMDGHAACLALGRGNDKLPLPLVPDVPVAPAPGVLLDELLDVYDEGQSHPLRLPPRSGWTWARDMATRRQPDVDRALAAARRTWEGECADPWIALALRGVDPLADGHFVELAQTVYGPLWRALQDGAAA